MAVTESEVVRTIRRFKAALLSGEEAEMREMARRYLQVEEALVEGIEALAEQVARMQAQGQTPGWALVYRLERYQRLEAQLVAELAKFNGWVASRIRSRQLELADRGAAEALSVLERLNLRTYELLDVMPHEAVRGMAGMAADGSPLVALLDKSLGPIREALLRELVTGVALGRNPRKVAALMRRATGIGLQRAMTIARTEALRAYNGAAMAAYRSMGVRQVMRIATLDDRTCIGCLVADGELLPSEDALDDHPNGRCAAVPYLPDLGLAQPLRVSGRDWFASQDAATQRAVMGPGRYELWSSGQAAWSDLAVHTRDDVWGGAWTPTSVRDLKAAAGTAAGRAA